MIFEERKKSIYSADSSYYTIHYISADFITDLKTRRKLETYYPNYMETWGMCGMRGDCLLVDRELYLVVKERYYQKPNYISMEEALEELKQICERNYIEKIVIPKTDCMSDRLMWFRVRRILLITFADTDMNVLVRESH